MTKSCDLVAEKQELYSLTYQRRLCPDPEAGSSLGRLADWSQSPRHLDQDHSGWNAPGIWKQHQQLLIFTFFETRKWFTLLQNEKSVTSTSLLPCSCQSLCHTCIVVLCDTNCGLDLLQHLRLSSIKSHYWSQFGYSIHLTVVLISCGESMRNRLSFNCCKSTVCLFFIPGINVLQVHLSPLCLHPHSSGSPWDTHVATVHRWAMEDVGLSTMQSICTKGQQFLLIFTFHLNIIRSQLRANQSENIECW